MFNTEKSTRYRLRGLNLPALLTNFSQVRFAMALLLALGSTNAVMAQTDAQPARHTGELQVSDEAVQLHYLTSGDRFGAANSDALFGLFLNEDRDIVASAGLLIETNLIRWQRLSIKVGPKAYAALLGDEDTDIVAFAFGAEVRYNVWPRIGLNVIGYGYYAPDILTFGTADNVREVGVRAQIPFADRFSGFVGIRDYDIDLLDDTRELQSSVVVGIRYDF